MNVCYIKEASSYDEMMEGWQAKLPGIIKKAIFKFRYIFNIVKIKVIDNKRVCILPIMQNKEITPNKINKLLNSFGKKIKISYSPNIALSQYLYSNLNFKSAINKYNLIDGNKIFNLMIFDIIKYICLKRKSNIQEQNVTILVNNSSGINIQNIHLLANNVKSVDIVSNNIEKFTKIQNQIYEDVGMMIKVSNNKRKSLNKANIIINIDFTEEETKKYNLPKDGIIINVNNKNIEYKKQFGGVVINYFESKFSEKAIEFFKKLNLYDTFDKTVLLESIFYENTNFKDMREKIDKQNVIISSVIGNKGKIDDLEFLAKNA